MVEDNRFYQIESVANLQKHLNRIYEWAGTWRTDNISQEENMRWRGEDTCVTVGLLWRK